MPYARLSNLARMALAAAVAFAGLAMPAGGAAPAREGTPPTAQPSQKAAERAKKLKKNDFRANIYGLPADKRTLYLGYAMIRHDGSVVPATIGKEQGFRIIDHLLS